ncbi:MAG: hypothetical protein NVV60_05075 [Luteimonas sp.]|nr:hypothetical protein [Luteimonas sp.]
MPDADHEVAATRRILFARIAARAGERDVLRAERLLLRGLQRQWPDALISNLLHGLLARAMPGTPRGDAP